MSRAHGQVGHWKGMKAWEVVVPSFECISLKETDYCSTQQ
jgi:hypothetical protein